MWRMLARDEWSRVQANPRDACTGMPFSRRNVIESANRTISQNVEGSLLCVSGHVVCCALD